MDIGVFIGNVAGDPVFIAIYGLLLLSVFNLASGAFRAWQNDVFTWSAVHAWVKKDGGSIIPVLLYLALGKALTVVPIATAGLPKELAGDVVIAYGLAQGTTVAIALFASIRENLSPAAQATTAAKAVQAEKIGDPVPDA